MSVLLVIQIFIQNYVFWKNRRDWLHLGANMVDRRIAAYYTAFVAWFTVVRDRFVAITREGAL